jgi:hypothetical protein
LISDGGFSEEARRTVPADVDVRYAAIGGSGRHDSAGNVGIISFAARRLPADPSAVEAAVVIQNFGREPASLAVDISAGDTTVERVRWSWRPASAGAISSPTCSPPTRGCGRGCLTAAGAPADDDLALDDTRSRWSPPSPAAACCAWAARTSISTARCSASGAPSPSIA